MTDIERARQRRRVNATVAALVADTDGEWWSLAYLLACIRLQARGEW